MADSQCAYLDNAASEPLRPEVLSVYQEALAELGGAGANPNSAHQAGRRASVLLEDARSRIAQLLGADPAEVIFTGGGTESVTLAVRGLALGAQVESRHRILHSAVEHDCVREAAKSVPGATATELPVDHHGVLTREGLRANLDGTVGLVSVILVGNENGVIQPVSLLAEAIKEQAAEGAYPRPALHTDAVAALGRMEIDFHQLGVDALSVAGHKVGGPVNSGLLLLKRDVTCVSERAGGGQERKIRGGTQDVLAAVGLAKAIELAHQELERTQVQHLALRGRLLGGLSELGGVRLAAPEAASVPGIVQLLLDGCEAEALIMALDQQGICVSAGSACHTGVARPSAVLLAQGYSEAEALGTLRVSFGWNTTVADVDRLVTALPGAMEISRRFAAGVQARGKR